MKIQRNNDEIDSYLWYSENGYMNNKLTDFCYLSSYQSYNHGIGSMNTEYITIVNMMPVYFLGDIAQIRREALEIYDLPSEDKDELKDVHIVLNEINIDREANGIIRQINFPPLEKLEEIFGEEHFGETYDYFHGALVGDWLDDIYKTFIQTLSYHTASGELIYILGIEYSVQGERDITTKHFEFYMRNNSTRYLDVYYARSTCRDANFIYKHLTHKFAYPDKLTEMDLYNVF